MPSEKTAVEKTKTLKFFTTEKSNNNNAKTVIFLWVYCIEPYSIDTLDFYLEKETNLHTKQNWHLIQIGRTG